jgi:hypothetical protein
LKRNQTGPDSADDTARAHARRMAKHMRKAFWLGVACAILMVLSGAFAFVPGFIGLSLIGLGVNIYAAYAINRARLVTNRFPITHEARFGRTRGDFTAGYLAVLCLLGIGLWVTAILE